MHIHITERDEITIMVPTQVLPNVDYQKYVRGTKAYVGITCQITVWLGDEQYVCRVNRATVTKEELDWVLVLANNQLVTDRKVVVAATGTSSRADTPQLGIKTINLNPDSRPEFWMSLIE